MNETLPLVTVVALSYNHEQFLVETLNSIQNQTYKQIQLIILDNNSQDDSVGKINEWIKTSSLDPLFIPNHKNLGVCAALNLALEHTKGEFFQFISCDDILSFNKIELQVSFFHKLPDSLAFIYGNFDFIDEHGKVLPEMNRFEKNGWHSVYDLPAGKIRSEFIQNYSLCAPTLLYRTSCIHAIGRYDEDIPFEDFQMNIRLLEKYACQGMMEILCQYRVLSNSFYNSTSLLRIERNYLHTMKYVYGYNYQQNWVILLRYISTKDGFIYRILKKILFYIINLISKEYKREYQIK
ncbi:glycosyltransferase [Algoriphagus sp.]|uniref:glycosyltransferase n=1 Tax=Algoriphagus sp. TaxID=1872435 RepID=UPI00391D8648